MICMYLGYLIMYSTVSFETKNSHGKQNPIIILYYINEMIAIKYIKFQKSKFKYHQISELNSANSILYQTVFICSTYIFFERICD